MVRISRFSRLRVAGASNRPSSRPQPAPNTRAATLYARGNRAARTPPAEMAAAATLKAKRHTASSRATTWSSTSTNSPLAPYWEMVIMVLAGAVAVATAPKSKEKLQSILKARRVTKATRTPAGRDSARVKPMVFAPAFCRDSRVKYFPTPKAMHARAISLTNSMFSKISPGTRPKAQDLGRSQPGCSRSRWAASPAWSNG